MRYLLVATFMFFGCGQNDSGDGNSQDQLVNSDVAPVVVAGTEDSTDPLKDKLALNVAGKTIYVDKKGWEEATDLSAYNAFTSNDYSCRKSEVKPTVQYSGTDERTRYQIRSFDESFDLEYEYQIYTYVYQTKVELFNLPETDPAEPELIRMLQYTGNIYTETESKKVSFVIIASSDLTDDNRTIEQLSEDKSIRVLSKYSDNICAYLQ